MSASSKSNGSPGERSSSPATTPTRASGAAAATAGAGLPELDDWFLKLAAHAWHRDDDEAFAEALRLLRAKARQLAGADPTPLVPTLAALAAATWYETTHWLANLKLDRAQDPDPRDKCYSRALRRCQSAMRTPTLVQRMRLPSMQLNQINLVLGHQQVNASVVSKPG